MATSATLIKRVEELTECAICLDELVDPKSLPCLHTFCLNCIRSHCTGKSTGDKSDCPVCRSSFVIPRPGVEQLKSNFFIKVLVEAKQASGRESDVVQCDVCSQDAEMNPSGTPVGATLYCTCCGQKLCTHCSKSHQKIPGGAHQFVPFGNNIAEDLLNLQGSFCSVHPGNKLEIYCATCHTNVCITCHAMKHRNHKRFPEVEITGTDIRDHEKATINLQKSVHSVIGITKKCIDGRTILEDRNTSVLLSHMLPDLQAWRRAYNDIKEIRIICTDRLSIDCDLVNSDWHGINIAIVANVIEVMCNCLIDVSGLKAPDHTVPAASATDPGDDGAPGEHGIAGESGGNVLLCCSTMRGNQLRINSLGGNGGKGQDGGNGMDGKTGVEKGKSFTADQFKVKYPTFARWSSAGNIVKIANTVDRCEIHQCNLFDGNYVKNASDLWVMAQYNSKLIYNVYMDFKPLRGARVTASLYQTCNPLVVKHCYLLFKGAPGEAGQKGGRGGKGGQGGAKGIGGNVSVVNLDGKDLTVHNIEIGRKNGADGDDGLDGTGGMRGKEGCKGEDHAYIDWFYSGSTRYYHGYNLEILYSETGSSESVWCSEKCKYASIVDKGASPSTVTERNYEKVLSRQLPAQSVPKEALNFDRIRYDVHAKLIHSLGEEKPVSGLTTLNNQLFVRYQSKTDITVYDTETFRFKRYLQVPGLGSVKDMTSCERNQCIYIADNVNEVVHRVDSKNKITQWSVVDEPNSLSVNSVYHVLVTCNSGGKIKEFTTDGQLIREISLHFDAVHLSHAVELTRDQFVVCHGYGSDPLHRVCLIDSSGRVLQSYGGSRGSGIGKLSTPVRLSVSGFILVADCANHRVLMLSPKLGFLREVVSGLRGPMRTWLDERTSRLYVADNKLENGTWVSGQVKVYTMG